MFPTFRSHSTPYPKKREWGAEKDLTPLSNLHKVPSGREMAISRLAIVLTLIFWFAYVTSVVVRQFIDGPQSYQFTMEAFGYLIVVSFLNFSALMYLLARQGALQRFARHIRVPRAVLDDHFSKHRPGVTVLVPSVGEEVAVIRKTLLSAALQEYPSLKVVLLLDDDYRKIRPEHAKRFAQTQLIGKEIQKLLAKPHNRFKKVLARYNKTKKTSAAAIAKEYEWAAKWLSDMADREEIDDHVDIFFTDQVLRKLANDLELVSQALKTAHAQGVRLTPSRIQQLYQRLTWIFGVEMSVFERKKYASLSSEPNKAMNLNSYIGLMGGRYREEQTSDGTLLIRTAKSDHRGFNIPDSEFILTLDADSILLREYCLRLVYFLQQPDNARVAVTQTPYSSFRGAPSRIERLSAATTDIQHILHQGMSYYDATFWVGANAVIRKKALEDIAEKEWINGFEIKRYVQDRTVIEDTESSIDLSLHGWKLVNYPERLSYSATPPDFGSLVVQRRRWANGGLLILPKLLAQLKRMTLPQFLLRINYMASIAWANFGLVFLLAYPYDGRLLSPLVLIAALPYFAAMASDLKYCRYNYTDIFRIYGFNLILLPVNLAGVLKSLQQALTTKKIPFARTPKVKNRTAVGLLYVLSPLFIVGFSVFTLLRNIEGQNWGNAAFAGFNALAATWAIVTYIGIGNLIADIWLGLTDWLYVEDKKPAAKKIDPAKSDLDWKAVLYHGEEKGTVPFGAI